MENLPVENSSGSDVLKLDCPAKKHALHTALDTIEKACDTWKIDSALVSRARIVVEELFSNTIKYGYGGPCDGAVRIRLSADPVLTLAYGDDAPLFDPTRWKAQENEGVLPDQRPEGQAGIAMVIGLCATASYQARDGHNCLTLTFAA